MTAAAAPAQNAEPSSGTDAAHGPRLERGELLLALVILLVTAVPRVILAMRTMDFGSDGGLYTDIALHLRDGDGWMRTSISDFHHGHRAFPHPSSVYPLWPTLLGLLLFVLPIKIACVWLSVVLTQVAIGAAFFAGRTLSARPLLSWLGRAAPRFHAGHVLMLCLGMHFGFYEHSTRPYTEPLAFLSWMVFIVRARTLCARLSGRDALELGAWLALLVYARAHFLVFVAAVALAFLCEAALRVRERSGAARVMLAGAAALATAAALFLPFLLYMRGFLEKPTLGTYLRYDQARARGASELLEPFAPILAGGRDRLEHLATLAKGFYLSFTPGWTHGYYTAVRALCFGIPLVAAVLVLWLAVRRREALVPIRAITRGPDRLWWLTVLGCAAAGFLSLHAIHKSWGLGWYFNHRHGVTVVLAFAIAWLVLLAFPWRVVARASAVVFLIGCAQAYRLQIEDAYQPRAFGRMYGLRAERPLFEKWLSARVREEGPLVVASSQRIARKVAWRLPTDVRRHIGFHDMSQHTSLRAVLQLTGPLGADYLVISSDKFAPPAIGEPGFHDAFELVEMIREARPRSDRGPALIFRRRSAVPGPVYVAPIDASPP